MQQNIMDNPVTGEEAVKQTVFKLKKQKQAKKSTK